MLPSYGIAYPVYRSDAERGQRNIGTPSDPTFHPSEHVSSEVVKYPAFWMNRRSVAQPLPKAEESTSLTKRRVAGYSHLLTLVVSGMFDYRALPYPLSWAVALAVSAATLPLAVLSAGLRVASGKCTFRCVCATRTPVC